MSLFPNHHQIYFLNHLGLNVFIDSFFRSFKTNLLSGSYICQPHPGGFIVNGSNPPIRIFTCSFIPNALNLDTYPYFEFDNYLRSTYTSHKPYLLLSHKSFSNPRKGTDLLESILSRLSKELQFELIIVILLITFFVQPLFLYICMAQSPLNTSLHAFII